MTDATGRFLVLHGLTNRRPEGHWERRLVAELRRRGHVVAYPQLPDPDSPDLATWLELLDAELALLDEAGDAPLTVVGHSLGAVLWLHAAARGVGVRPDRVLLVAPAGPDELEAPAPGWPIRPDRGEVTAAQVAAAAGSTLLVWSGADRWCAAGCDVVYAGPLGLATALVPGGGHLALADGFGPWAGVVAWALGDEPRWTDR